MQTEYLFLYGVYGFCFILLAYVPRHRWREASIAFLFQQFVTWFLGLLVVELRLIEYPVRELAHVTRSSFVFEFLALPIVSIFFCLYFPGNRGAWAKFLYTSFFSTILTIPEIMIEKYTDLIHYHKWEWYTTWLSIAATLYLAEIFYCWYFRLGKE